MLYYKAVQIRYTVKCQILNPGSPLTPFDLAVAIASSGPLSSWPSRTIYHAAVATPSMVYHRGRWPDATVPPQRLDSVNAAARSDLVVGATLIAIFFLCRLASRAGSGLGRA
ncbi:hypothetical protein GUJ93_ZPchr0009g2370 [Zizania palustris]|uniref:Uncharacterized protein n=1 Tax=Zizania palustris TaxID=103762 RepID=A0A8J5V5V9_ZIZPA|nr:hypothetical protein GUJ93_ZPchr0009g2370 [Zizania palustris]